jgi:hypothetical protein
VNVFVGVLFAGFVFMLPTSVALVRLIADKEYASWAPALAGLIARFGLAFIPVAHRERYREEWLAELDAKREEGQPPIFWAVSMLFGSIRLRPTLKRTPPQRAVAGDTSPAPAEEAAEEAAETLDARTPIRTFWSEMEGTGFWRARDGSFGDGPLRDGPLGQRGGPREGEERSPE